MGDLLKGNLLIGLAVTVGAVALAPVLLPALATVGKPVAKALIKSGIIFYEKSRETFAELSEVAEDLYAEAQAEVAQASAANSEKPQAPRQPPAPVQAQGQPTQPSAAG